MKKISLLFICFWASLNISAQYNSNRNKVWTLGNNVGLDFTSSLPVPFTTSLPVLEAAASVCNSVGQLQFYTDGKEIYNRYGWMMPGASAIVPFSTYSSTHGAVIVPFIGDTNKYYVFSLEQLGFAKPGKLAYTVVDMTLNSGLGGTVVGSIGIVLDSGMSEKMLAIPGVGCNIWLLTHKRDTPQFYAYSITPFGLNTTPVISATGSFTGINRYAQGAMKCSHDKKKIVTVTNLYSALPTGGWGIELYDFNSATGIVSNSRTLDLNPTAEPYGAEFSPDNTKLYASMNGIYQWDITLSTTTAIVASKTLVSTFSTTRETDLRLGPDDKIYINGDYLTYFLDRINFPNLTGASCGYTPNAVNVSPNTVTLGFPTLVWNVQPIVGADSICTGMTKTLTTMATGGTWTSSNSSIAIIGASSGIITGVSPGTSTISYTYPGGCMEVTVVTVNSTSIGSISGMLAICQEGTSTLTCSPSGGTWSSSTLAAVITSSGIVTGAFAGTTTITYTLSSGCYSTVIVTVNPCHLGSEQIDKENQINLYPNPASDELLITTLQTAYTDYSIQDLSGQQFIRNRLTGNATKVSLKHLSPGVYLLILTGNDCRKILRFSKW